METTPQHNQSTIGQSQPATSPAQSGSAPSPRQQPPTPPQSLNWWDENEWIGDYNWRRDFVKNMGLLGFGLIYLPHYFYLKPAKFHKKMFDVLWDMDEKRVEIIGARGIAKSTAGSLALPVAAALERPNDYPFIIPISDTGTQASINIANIKNELDNNFLILKDYGKIQYDSGTDEAASEDPSLESDEEWQAKNMLLNNGVRILARSRGQKVRGLRHREHRPKLVTVDDPEDTKWVKFKKNRDETMKWMQDEVLPSIDPHTGKMVVIGNFLHNDALMMRLKKLGIFKCYEYPLINPKTKKCLWTGLYPSKKKLEEKRKEMGEVSWQREMLLKIVPEEGAPLTPSDIVYYDELPGVDRGIRGHGVDLAISEKERADYTSIVSGDVYRVNEKPYIYILPNPINAHLDFRDTIDTIKKMAVQGGSHIFFVEDVGYQKAAIEELQRAFIGVHPVHPGTDKLSRLKLAARHIKDGQVLFPRHGAENLLDQIL